MNMVGGWRGLSLDRSDDSAVTVCSSYHYCVLITGESWPTLWQKLLANSASRSKLGLFIADVVVPDGEKLSCTLGLESENGSRGERGMGELTRNFVSQWMQQETRGLSDTGDDPETQWRSVQRVSARSQPTLREDDVESVYANDAAPQWLGWACAANRRSLSRRMLTTATAAALTDGIELASQEQPSDSSVFMKSRARPQSASTFRTQNSRDTAANLNLEVDFKAATFANRRSRPQSAKLPRSHHGAGTKEKSPSPSALLSSVIPQQMNGFKWTEMMFRSPDFQQTNLIRLEHETYELLQSVFRKERRAMQASNSSDLVKQKKQKKLKSKLNAVAMKSTKASEAKQKPKKKKMEDCDNTLKSVPCGSGMQLARDRKLNGPSGPVQSHKKKQIQCTKIQQHTHHVVSSPNHIECGNLLRTAFTPRQLARKTTTGKESTTKKSSRSEAKETLREEESSQLRDEDDAVRDRVLLEMGWVQEENDTDHVHIVKAKKRETRDRLKHGRQAKQKPDNQSVASGGLAVQLLPPDRSRLGFKAPLESSLHMQPEYGKPSRAFNEDTSGQVRLTAEKEQTELQTRNAEDELELLFISIPDENPNRNMPPLDSGAVNLDLRSVVSTPAPRPVDIGDEIQDRKKEALLGLLVKNEDDLDRRQLLSDLDASPAVNQTLRRRFTLEQSHVSTCNDEIGGSLVAAPDHLQQETRHPDAVSDSPIGATANISLQLLSEEGTGDKQEQDVQSSEGMGEEEVSGNWLPDATTSPRSRQPEPMRERALSSIGACGAEIDSRGSEFAGKGESDRWSCPSRLQALASSHVFDPDRLDVEPSVFCVSVTSPGRGLPTPNQSTCTEREIDEIMETGELELKMTPGAMNAKDLSLTMEASFSFVDEDNGEEEQQLRGSSDEPLEGIEGSDGSTDSNKTDLLSPEATRVDSTCCADDTRSAIEGLEDEKDPDPQDGSARANVTGDACGDHESAPNDLTESGSGVNWDYCSSDAVELLHHEADQCGRSRGTDLIPNLASDESSSETKNSAAIVQTAACNTAAVAGDVAPFDWVTEAASRFQQSEDVMYTQLDSKSPTGDKVHENPYELPIVVVQEVGCASDDSAFRSIGGEGKDSIDNASIERVSDYEAEEAIMSVVSSENQEATPRIVSHNVVLQTIDLSSEHDEHVGLHGAEAGGLKAANRAEVHNAVPQERGVDTKCRCASEQEQNDSAPRNIDDVVVSDSASGAAESEPLGDPDPFMQVWQSLRETDTDGQAIPPISCDNNVQGARRADPSPDAETCDAERAEVDDTSPASEAESVTQVVHGVADLPECVSSLDEKTNERVDQPSQRDREAILVLEGEILQRKESETVISPVSEDLLAVIGSDSTHSEAEVVISEPNEARFDAAVRRIQRQYHCFVQRQILVDQLKFLVSQHHRQMRKKTRRASTEVKIATMSSGLPNARAAPSLSAGSSLAALEIEKPTQVVDAALENAASPSLAATEVPDHQVDSEEQREQNAREQARNDVRPEVDLHKEEPTEPQQGLMDGEVEITAESRRGEDPSTCAAVAFDDDAVCMAVGGNSNEAITSENDSEKDDSSWDNLGRSLQEDCGAQGEGGESLALVKSVCGEQTVHGGWTHERTEASSVRDSELRTELSIAAEEGELGDSKELQLGAAPQPATSMPEDNKPATEVVETGCFRGEEEPVSDLIAEPPLVVSQPETQGSSADNDAYLRLQAASIALAALAFDDDDTDNDSDREALSSQVLLSNDSSPKEVAVNAFYPVTAMTWEEENSVYETARDDASATDYWERYVDAATNKSYYFNPSTQVSQWTLPEYCDVVDKVAAFGDSVVMANPNTTFALVESGDAAQQQEAWHQVRKQSLLLESFGGWSKYLMNESATIFFYHQERDEYCSSAEGSTMTDGTAPLEFSEAQAQLLYEPHLSPAEPFLPTEEASVRSYEMTDEDTAGHESSSRTSVERWSLRRKVSQSAEKRGAWQAFVDAESGHPFYYNVHTGESSWDKPAVFQHEPSDAHEWGMCMDDATDAAFYVNLATGETSWDKPADFDSYLVEPEVAIHGTYDGDVGRVDHRQSHHEREADEEDGEDEYVIRIDEEHSAELLDTLF